ncbi:MAG: hypothetical protein ACREJC_11425 [Tepidisphaeraceae bacterium]
MTTSTTHPDRRAALRGFTFVELCLGLVVTSLVLSALSAFVLAVSNVWQASDAAQCSAIANGQTTLRLQKRLLDARQIGYYRATGPAAVIYWRGDFNGDSKINYSELAVLAHNPTARTLNVYESNSGAGAPDPVWTSAVFSDSGVIDQFIAALTPTPIARNISEATFEVQNAGGSTVCPTLHFSLGFRNNDVTEFEAGAVSLRAAAPLPQ